MALFGHIGCQNKHGANGGTSQCVNTLLQLYVNQDGGQVQLQMGLRPLNFKRNKEALQVSSKAARNLEISVSETSTRRIQ